MSTDELVRALLIDVYNTAISGVAQKVQELPLAPEIKAMVLNTFKAGQVDTLEMRNFASGNVAFIFGKDDDSPVLPMSLEELEAIMNFTEDTIGDAGDELCEGEEAEE